MQCETLRISGVTISRVLMGTWQAGKKLWPGIQDADIKAALLAALEAGVTTFDTAEEYGWGYSERLVGSTLKAFRPKVVLATKVFCNHLRRDEVIAACERSLKNLRTDYIDLYQIHWPAGSWNTPLVPLEETLGAMLDLKRQGKIRAVGVSNFSLPQLKAAVALAPIDTLQPPYSLLWRQAEQELAPYCRREGIVLLAYSPMAQGILTGRIGRGHRFARGDHRVRHRLLAPEHVERVQCALDALRPMAGSRGITLGQLALAWVLGHPGTCAIAGARNAAQIVESARAADIALEDSEMAALDRISEGVTAFLDDDPVMWRF